MDLEEEKKHLNNLDTEYEVEQILDYRIISKNTRGRKPKKKERKKIIYKEYLVKWVGYDNPTWEPEKNLIHCQALLNTFFERKIMEENDNNIKKPKNNIPQKGKLTRIKHKKKLLNNSTKNKTQQNITNKNDINDNSNKNENHDSLSLIDKRDVFNFFDNFNLRDFNENEEKINFRNDFESANDLNLCSFKDGMLSNTKGNDEKENSENSSEKIILSSNSLNNTNKFLDENNSKMFSISEFNSCNKEKNKEKFDINCQNKLLKENNNSININTIEENENNILNSFGNISNNEKENKNEDNIKIIDICGMEIPTDFDEGISLKIIYEKDKEQFIQTIKSSSGKIPKDILIKYYEMFIYDNYKGQNYGKRLSSKYIV